MEKYLFFSRKRYLTFSVGKIILLIVAILAATNFVKAQSAVDLQVYSMLLSPSPMVLGSADPIWLRVDVKRNNKVAATGVVLTLDLPDGIRLDSVKTNVGSCSFADKVITCNLGTLDKFPFEYDASIDFYLRPVVKGLFVLTTRVAGNEPDTILSNNSATVQTIIYATKGNKRVRAIFAH